MTRGEINELALEYALNVNPPTEVKGQVNFNQCVDFNARLFTEFLEWLCKDHVVLERKKATSIWLLANDLKVKSDIQKVNVQYVENLLGKELYPDEYPET